MDAASRGDTRQLYSHLRDVCLCNPATRQFRILPKSIPIKESMGYDFVAFGFNVKTKDYKVLRITPKDLEQCMCRVQVYSLSTDSWKLLEGIDSLPVVPRLGNKPNHGIYLNGSYYFIQRKETTDDCMLLSFDFTKEIFTTMQLPDVKCSSGLVLSYLGEKLVVFTTTSEIDIWMLNEQLGGGDDSCVNKESWTKLRMKSRRNGKPCIDSIYLYSSCIESIYLSNFGREELEEVLDLLSNRIDLFNLVTKEAKEAFLVSFKGCRADVYKESLVSIMGGGNVLLKWQKLPTDGTTTYKLSLDAPFIGFYSHFGIGLCLTSETGGCIRVRSLKRYASDAKQGEALAMLEAIKWAKMLKLSPIIIETHFKSSRSLKRAKHLLNSSELDISFQHCSTSCNYVAEAAAKLGRDGDWSCMDWTAEDFHGEVVRSLSKGLGHRG